MFCLKHKDTSLKLCCFKTREEISSLRGSIIVFCHPLQQLSLQEEGGVLNKQIHHVSFLLYTTGPSTTPSIAPHYHSSPH